jgi:hypothetical protein
MKTPSVAEQLIRNVKFQSNNQSGLERDNDMSNRIPNFTYSSPKASDRYTACIEMDGQPFHKIKNLDVFYQELGYTPEIRKAGLLPDEFIWEKYIKGDPSTFAGCLQMHIVEYLAKNSITFINEFGYQYQTWFEEHVEAVTEKNILCVTCRIKSFCHIGMTSFQMPASLSSWLGGLTNDDQ